MTTDQSAPDDRPATMTVEAAARRLGIGRQLAYSLASEGKLPGALRLGKKRIVVSTVLLEAFLTDGRANLPLAWRGHQVEDAAQISKQG